MSSRCRGPVLSVCTSGSTHPRTMASLVVAVTCLSVGLLTARSATATGYSWIGTSGSAGTASNWSPSGVPQPLDYAIFSSATAGTITWPANVDSLDRLYVSAGGPTFQITSRLGLASVFTLGPGQLGLSSGKMASPKWLCAAGSSSYTYMVVDGPGTEADATGALQTSTFNGSSTQYCDLTLQNGGSFLSSGALSFGASFPARAYVHGQSGGYSPTLATLTAGPNGRGSISVGDQGFGQIVAYDGGQVLSAGDVFLGRSVGGTGFLDFFSSAAQQPTVCVIKGQTYVGANDVAGVAAGGAYLQFDKGFATLGGTCWVGDPDDSPSAGTKATLDVQDGQLVIGNGLITSPALTGSVHLDGGTTQVIGGPLTVRQSGPFYIGSVVGAAPAQLWLENNTVNDLYAPDTSTDALDLGRAVMATLRVIGPGTVLNVHGKSVLFDQTGGYGSLTVDSAAVVSFTDSLTVGGEGGGTVLVKSPGGHLSVSGPLTLSSFTQGFVTAEVDSFATADLSGGLTTVGPGPSLMLAQRGSNVSIHGVALGGVGELEVGRSTHVTVTDHFDMTGDGRVVIDTAGVLTYNAVTQPLRVGFSSLGERSQSYVWVFQGGQAQLGPETDVRGLLYFAVGTGSTLIANAPALKRVGQPGATRASQSLLDYGPLAVVQCPLTRVLGSGVVRGFGTLKGRLHIESPNASLFVPAFYYETAGPEARTVVGDSTATDGFVSVGQTTVGADTLLILDKDGGDLGRVSLGDGVLQLPTTGHLNSGDMLTGTGRIEGSLDVRSGGRLGFVGTIKGSVQMAGELWQGTDPGLLSILGGLQVLPGGRLTLLIGASTQGLVAVGGTAALGGTLDVRGIGGNLPVPGDTLTLLTAGSITGIFATVTFNGGPAAGVIHVIYGPTSVRVAIIGAITAVGNEPPPAVIHELRFAATGGPHDAGLILDLPMNAHAQVELYDVTGRRIAVLEHSDLAPGQHRYALRREDVPESGVYFARAAIRTDAMLRILKARVVLLR
jgi:hypothetical protein